MELLRLLNAERVKAKLEKEQLKEVRNIYHQAAVNIEQKRKAYSDNLGDWDYLNKLYLEQLQSQITVEMYRVQNQLGGLVEKGALAISETVAKDFTEYVNKLGFRGGFSAVPRRTLELLISGQIYDKPWTLSNSIWKNTQHTEEIARRIIAQGLAEQKSALEIIKDVEIYIDPKKRKPWDWGRVHPQAATSVEYNTQRLVRSMIQHSYEQTVVQCTKDNPFCIGIKWMLASSHRHCPWCIANASEDRFGLGVGIFPQDDLPLDHPNGYCIFVPAMVDSNLMADRIGRWAKGSSDAALDKYQKYLLENDM